MITATELLRVLLAPVLVAAVVAAIGRWRGWAWAMPLAAGAGFVAGYALIHVPRLPPHDGNDWLFWLAIPATLLGVLDAWIDRRWGSWAFGAVGAGLVTLVTALPLMGGESTGPGAVALMCAVTAAAGALLCFGLRAAEPRVGSWAVAAALCITTGAAAIVVMSSGLRLLGVYGIAAAAALGPVAVLIGRNAARGVAVASAAILTGLLAASWYYAYPGTSAIHFAVLMAAPALVWLGAIVPAKKHPWLRGVAAVVAVAVAVGAITVPTALTAKREAESIQDDPYAGYYGQ